MLGLAQAIELQLAEVRKRDQMLTIFKAELDAINNSDKDQRTSLETEKGQLEQTRQTLQEQLRQVDQRLLVIDQSLRIAEQEKAQKVKELYHRSQGLLI